MPETLHRSYDQISAQSPNQDRNQKSALPGMSINRYELQDYLSSYSFENYYDDYSSLNYNTLLQYNPNMAEVYANLITDFPELRNIVLIENDEQNGYYNHSATMGAALHEAISVDYEHPESYTIPENLESGDTQGLEEILKLQALMFGCDPTDVMHNPNLVSAFVLLHEAGHALDFRHHYFASDLTSDASDVECLSEAIVKFSRDYNRGRAAMPIPGQLDINIDEQACHRFRSRLAAMGIDPSNREEISEAQQKAYRDKIPAEAFADRFAANFIYRHWEDFFESPDDPTHTTGKIRPKFGELINMSDDPYLLGLNSGTEIKFTKVESDPISGLPILDHGRPISRGESETRFLAKNLRLDEPFSVYQRGCADPAHGVIAHSVDTVREIYTIPLQYPDGSVYNQIILRMQDEDGNFSSLQAEITNTEPIKVITSPEKMMARLGLTEGSKVQLMKVQQNSESAVDEFSILSGELYRPAYWPGNNPSPIQYDHGIHLRPCADKLNDESDFYLYGGNTSRIEEVYRKWSSYYVQTLTSVYEVIPY